MIRIEQSIPADCYVLADPQRLRQVLLNLISNAVKYNHDGGTIWLSSSLTSHGSVQLAVRDTGRGIPPEKLDRLFTPFDRLGAEQSGIEGTGIGLALVQRLVHAMNGTITVQSSLGEGSTFTLELASASITEFASTPSSEHVRVEPVILYATPVMATSPTLAGHNTLLYIEDTSSNRELVKTVLQRRPGITLLMAEEGGIGIELARQHMPDLILLDLHLPDMSGEQVLEQLRADPALAQIPVIVVSADATAVRIEQAMRAGARDYLTKPLSVRQFLMVLEDLVTPA
jgi:CheY-like chemotaxis protein/anti-sigma regulatory factor (Ser/Thr protein kinase)